MENNRIPARIGQDPIHTWMSSRARICNLLRSPGVDSQPDGPVRQPYLSYRPAMLHRQVESNPRNRFSFTNTGSVHQLLYRTWLLYVHWKLSPRKLSHYSNIEQACGSLRFLLEPKWEGSLLLFEYSNYKLIPVVLCMKYDDEHGVHELPEHLLQLSDHGADAVRWQPGEGLLPGGQRRTPRLSGPDN